MPLWVYICLYSLHGNADGTLTPGKLEYIYLALGHGPPRCLLRGGKAEGLAIAIDVQPGRELL
jgi:hypothetical protein